MQDWCRAIHWTEVPICRNGTTRQHRVLHVCRCERQSVTSIESGTRTHRCPMQWDTRSRRRSIRSCFSTTNCWESDVIHCCRSFSAQSMHPSAYLPPVATSSLPADPCVAVSSPTPEVTANLSRLSLPTAAKRKCDFFMKVFTLTWPQTSFLDCDSLPGAFLHCLSFSSDSLPFCLPLHHTDMHTRHRFA